MTIIIVYRVVLRDVDFAVFNLTHLIIEEVSSLAIFNIFNRDVIQKENQIKCVCKYSYKYFIVPKFNAK